MAKKRKVKSGSSVGSFFLGSFIGFILCLALIVGVGCFAYFKVSPAMLNKYFNVGLDFGSDEVNKKTLSDFVNSAVNLAQNVNTYTLNDLKKDFGIDVGADMLGISIEDLKSVGLEDLPQAIADKFASISADELKEIVDLSSMSNVMDKHNTYYYNSANGKLYEGFNGTSYLFEVDFKYSVNGNSVIVKGHSSNIEMNDEYGVLNEVNIQLWYLPLTNALSGFTENMGSQITLAELESDYGVVLPSFLDNIDKVNTTINNLETAINGLYVADFLGYTVNAANPANIIVEDLYGQPVEGLMYELAIETIGNLENLTDKFESLTAEDLEGTIDISSIDIFNKTNTYYINNTILYKDAEFTEEVDFDYLVSGLNVIIDEMNFIASAEKVEIPVKYLPITIAISDFTSNMGGKLTLQELKDDYGVVLPEYILKNNGAKTINEIDSIIDNLYVADILGYTIDGQTVKNGEDVVSGVMAIVAKKQVKDLSNLQSTINTTTISEILDLNIKQDISSGVYYDDRNNDGVMDADEKVANVMATIAETKVGELTGVINELKVSQIFAEAQRSSGILSLIDGDPTIEEIPSAIKDAIQTATIGELIEKDVISKPENYDSLKNDETTITKEDGETKKKIAELTLPELIDYCFDMLSDAKNN